MPWSDYPILRAEMYPIPQPGPGNVLSTLTGNIYIQPEEAI